MLAPLDLSPAVKHELDNRKTQIILAAICVALIVLDVVAAIIFPWWRARMSADFWPIDSSRIVFTSTHSLSARSCRQSLA